MIKIPLYLFDNEGWKGVRQMSEDYRTPPPKCEVCETRNEQKRKVRPFQELNYRSCPACQDIWVKITYLPPCSGNGTSVTLQVEPAGWFRKAKTIICQVNTIAHFHMKCNSCKFEWLMAAAHE